MPIPNVLIIGGQTILSLLKPRASPYECDNMVCTTIIHIDRDPHMLQIHLFSKYCSYI